MSVLVSGTRYRNFLQKYARWLCQILSLGLLLVVSGYFFFPKVAGVQTTFTVLVVLPALALLFSRKDFRFLRSRVFIAFALVPILLFCSHFWADASWGSENRDSWHFLKLTLYLLLFYCAVLFSLEHNRKYLALLLNILICIGFVTSLASLALYFDKYSFERFPRIGGISLAGDIDKTASFYALHILICAYGIIAGAKAWRRFSLIAVVPSFVFVLLSQTKIPLLIAVFAPVILCLLYSSHRRWLFVMMAFIGATIGFYVLMFDSIPILHRSGAYSVRIDLWSAAINEGLRHPWLGNGLVYKNFIELGNITMPHPHNYIADMFRFTGIAGVALCVWQLWVAAEAFFSLDRTSQCYWPGVILLIWLGAGVSCMLVYAQQPLVKPNYIWFMYWVPLALLYCLSWLERDRTEGKVSR